MDNPVEAFFGLLGWVLLHLLALAYLLIKFVWNHPFITILLVILWFTGAWIYGSWDDERIYRRYLARKYQPSTPPEERERKITETVDTAIAAISKYRPAVRGETP